MNKYDEMRHYNAMLYGMYLMLLRFRGEWSTDPKFQIGDYKGTLEEAIRNIEALLNGASD